MLDIGLRLALCVGLATALGGAVLAFGHHERDAGRAEVRAQWDADRATAMQAAIIDQQANAAETARRLAAQQEINNATTAQLNRARADADAARSAGDRLRAQLAAYVSAHRGDASSHPAPEPAGPPASAPVDLLADMFRDSDEAAGILAAALDAARAAGLACERAYDALTGPN